jgi:hypothetical protein
MIWASFGGLGPGELWFLPPNTTINADKYISILEEHLEPSMERLQCIVFQHDGAPCHQARKVREWLHSHDVTVLDWPGQSPAIENLWCQMKRKVATCQPTSLSHLKEVITQVWNDSVSPEECRKLAESMPRRIEAKGGHSKY